jgi:hypothetical protein
LLLVGAFFCPAFVYSASAEAAVSLRARELRSYEIPVGIDLSTAQITAAEDGRTIIAATTGVTRVVGEENLNAACTVVVVDEVGARSFEYRYRGGPTGCVGVVAHPEGGFFVRGARLAISAGGSKAGEVNGFTARIDGQGREVWALSDQALVDATSETEQGTGEFLGDYLKPHPQLAYSPAMDKLLAFSDASLSVADDRLVTQAHVIEAESGRLRVSGLTFGLAETRGTVVEAAARSDAGDFLIHTASLDGRDARFFAYNGRRGIDVFEPPGEDWSERVVRRMVYGADQRLYLLSTSPLQPGAAEIAVIDAQAEPVWTAELEGASDEGELGPARAMWVGLDYVLVYYLPRSGPVLRVIDAQNGRELGVVALSGLTENGLVTILSGANGRMRLLTIDVQSYIVHEFRLDFAAGDGADGDAGHGAVDSGDAGSGGADTGGGGCSAASAGSESPLSAAGLAFGLIVFTIASRSWPSRRLNRVRTGD